MNFNALALIVFPVYVLIVFEALPPSKKGFGWGLIVGVSGLAQAVGPSFGGFIIQWLSWRWIFLLNVPIGLLSVLLTILSYSENHLKHHCEKLDYLGAILLFFSLLFSMYALNELNSINLNYLFGLFLLTAIGIALFICWEKRAKSPLVDFKLFKDKNFVIANLVRAIVSFIFFSFTFIIGLYLQNVLGYSAIKAGLILLSLTVSFGILSPIAGTWIDRAGIKLPFMIGFISMILSFVILVILPVVQHWSSLIIPLILLGTTCGILIPGISMVALWSILENRIGIATGVFYTNACIGGALGIAFTGTLISFFNILKLKVFLNKIGLVVNHSQYVFLTHAVSGTNAVDKLNHYFQSDTVIKILSHEIPKIFIGGFTIVMMVCLVLSIIAMFLARFVRYEAKKTDISKSCCLMIE